MSYIRAMLERDKNMRLMVGCRASLKKGSHWTKGKFATFEPGRQVLLKGRKGDDFTIFALPKGFTGELTKDIKLYDGEMSWVHKDDMKLVDVNFAANLDFLDWYAGIEDDLCGDCLEAFTDEEGICPNPKCPGNNLEDYYDDED